MGKCCWISSEIGDFNNPCKTGLIKQLRLPTQGQIAWDYMLYKFPSTSTNRNILDVVVDIRHGSPSFGRWVGLTVSAELWNQILVPRGFAHGFVTIEEHSEVQDKVTAPYRPDLERCIRFDDPALEIDWPVAAAEVQLSAKDRKAPLLAELDTGFRW